MIAAIPSSTLHGIDGTPVLVEVHISPGLPGFTLVGLPDAACREARDRVRAALSSTKLTWSTKRTTVNLSPSDIRKVGSGLDLPIAVALMVAAELIPASAVEGMAFLGELGLDGTVRPIDGIVSLVAAIDAPKVVVPESLIGHAALVAQHEVLGVSSISHLLAALAGEEPWALPSELPVSKLPTEPDIADVRGQPVARWALEIAAAGGHNMIMTGPPGAGKTMLAKRLPGLLPDLETEVALVATRVHSVAGLLDFSSGLVRRPQLRAPHHTASMVSLVGGGGSKLRPGEVSLAHGGVLFLDEVCEFAPRALDSLREPLEEGVIRVARASGTAIFPARFLCVAAMNPCPCGEGLNPNLCVCSLSVRQRYIARLSGPLLDRFDLRIQLQRPNADDILSSGRTETTTEVRKRVEAVRMLARERGVISNSELTGEALLQYAPLTNDATRLLKSQLRKGTITARGLDRVRRVARTIADLDRESSFLDVQHISAALQLRPMFRAVEECA